MTPPSKNRFVRERLPWIITMLALVAVLATVYLARRPSVDPGATQQVPVDERATDGAAGTPRVDAPDAARTAGASRPSSRGRAAALAGEPDESLTPQQAAAQRERQLRELEAAFARDAAEADAGQRIEDALGQTLAGDAMASTGLVAEDVGIECKRRSCRIVGSFATMGDAQDWGLFFITAAGGDQIAQSQMMFVPTAAGRTEVRIFATRSR